MRLIINKDNKNWQETLKEFVLSVKEGDVIVVPSANLQAVTWSALKVAGKKGIRIEIGKE